MIELAKIKPIVEALIFASDVPLPENRIKSIIEELSVNQIQQVVDFLNSEYEQGNRAFQIKKIGGGYQFVTKSEYASYIKKYYKGRSKSKLSRASLETMAIIAFKQPISRPEIDSIRGVNSDGVVKNLLERNLIQIAGRSEGIGHALLYGTTQEFLSYFGINDISELPKPKEIEELLGSGQEELPFAEGELDQEISSQLSTLDEAEEITEDPLAEPSAINAADEKAE